jgi:hypothetical protein
MNYPATLLRDILKEQQLFFLHHNQLTVVQQIFARKPLMQRQQLGPDVV